MRNAWPRACTRHDPRFNTPSTGRPQDRRPVRRRVPETSFLRPARSPEESRRQAVRHDPGCRRHPRDRSDLLRSFSEKLEAAARRAAQGVTLNLQSLVLGSGGAAAVPMEGVARAMGTNQWLAPGGETPGLAQAVDGCSHPPLQRLERLLHGHPAGLDMNEGVGLRPSTRGSHAPGSWPRECCSTSPASSSPRSGTCSHPSRGAGTSWSPCPSRPAANTRRRAAR